MTPDERYDLIDQLPTDMGIWHDDDELKDLPGRDLAWWMNVLEHPRAHSGCCKTCGCATVCMVRLFHEAAVTSVLRELDKIGALRKSAKDRKAEAEQAERDDAAAR